MRPFATTWTAACGLLIGVTLLSVAPARAGGDDDVPFDTKILRSILTGIGLQDPTKGEIDYHERPPLVIPPDKTLPPPEKSGAAIANNPAWPKDPDIARARQIKRMEANRDTTAEIERDQHPLRPAEMTPGGNPRTPPSGRKIAVPLGEEGTRMSPSELGYKGGLFGLFKGKSDEAVRFTGEPARTSLTEPPPGYQTPSPQQPYGEGQAAAPKADNYYEKHGTEAR
jgi:hypothetical protein